MHNSPPPIQFHKYHAYGNAYTVINQQQFSDELTAVDIKNICDDAYGIGGDGLLIFTGHNNQQFNVRIFNPDGSEAEKSGNGLSIFAAYLIENRWAKQQSFTLKTPKSESSVTAVTQSDPYTFQVSLLVGQAKVTTTPLDIIVADQLISGYRVDIGNPHFVVFSSLSADKAHHIGPLIETHAAFPNRTNVQFVQIQDHANISIQIWERGAGYTAASGSSASAVTAVCHILGKTGPDLHVHMVGGTLPVQIDATTHQVKIHNTVHKIASGLITKPIN